MVDTIQEVNYSSQRIKEVSPGMWDDFYNDLRFGQQVNVYQNHFNAWMPAEWTVTEVNDSTQLTIDERNGILRLTPAGADNDGTNMQLGGTGTTGESWAPAAGKNLWFETRIRSNTDVDQNDVFVGLHVEDTTIIAGRGTDAIGFRIDDGDAQIDVESIAGSVTTQNTNIATAADATFVTLGFKVSSTDKIEFYVNNALTSTISTGIPTALMKLSLAHLSGEASANVLDIDYVIVAQDI